MTTMRGLIEEEYVAVIAGRPVARRSAERLTADVELVVAESGAQVAARLPDRDLELVEVWGTCWVLCSVDLRGHRELIGIYPDLHTGAVVLAEAAAPDTEGILVAYPSQAVAVAWLQLPDGELEITKSVRNRFVVRLHEHGPHAGEPEEPLCLASSLPDAVDWIFGPHGPAIAR